MMKDQVEDVYGLSPMQSGMLFLTLYASGSAVYQDQHVFELEGNLNITAFERAWQHLIARHAVLRTSFHWEGLEEPLQVVHATADLPIERLDWREMAAEEQETAFTALMARDHACRIDLSQPPLMRVMLVRTAPATWRILWTIHHLLVDRWSCAQIIAELGTAYEALCEERRVPLPTIRPYRNYIHWLRQQDPARAEAFWRRQLSGLNSPTVLPIDREPGSLQDTGRSEKVLALLSVETSQTLQTLCRQNRLTLNTVMQGAWALLLSRYTGEHDVLFGVTVSGRPASLPDVETMVGMFINSLPARVQVPDAMPVVAWLKRLQGEMVEMREYEYSSLVQIQGWSEIPRGVRLFQSLVIVQNVPTSDALQDPGEASPHPARLQIRKLGAEASNDFPLQLTVVPQRQVRLSLSYDGARYAREDIERMLSHVQTLLDGIVADPQCALSRLPLLTEPERQQRIVAWNDTRVTFPQESCIHQLIEQQVERTPDAIAVVCERQQLTYRELDQRANQLAHFLHKQGVTTETLVCLCVERSLDMVVGMLGILKAGAAYVPLDPAWPRERLALIADNSRLTFVLTQDHLCALVPQNIPQVICLDGQQAQITAESQYPLPANVTSANRAYVLHTSGSTGVPKGVQITHRAVVNFLDSMAVAPGITAQDTLLAVTTISFDIAGLELYLPLMAGARVVVASREDAMEGERLGQLLQESGATILQATPATWRMLLAAGWRGMPQLKALCGGEALPSDLAQALAVQCGELWNLYGPTETTIWSSVERIRSGESVISIGRPIGNTQIYLLDSRLQPVPVGVAGELYIGGEGLARGYLNRPDLTAEKFVADPFRSEPGARMYRTGDVMKYLPDGRLEFVGRADHQVKIRGFRIELEEIESRLREHPNVREAVVLAREDVPGERRLVAYLVGAAAAIEISELRAFVKERLPEYMAPSAWMWLEALPLTPNGKLDRKALPEPDRDQIAEARAFVAPRTSTEETLAGIWAALLRVERVGANDNFFELGGHSLLMTQMISRIRNAFQVEMPLHTLFEVANLAELAERIELAHGEETAPAPPLTRVSREERLPLSFAQQRLWFVDQFDPGSAAYNLPSALQLTGPLDIEALSRSLNELVRRHEALRTVFAVSDGEPMQVIREFASQDLPLTDLSALALTERQNEMQRRVREEALRPFHLAEGPLFRASLIRLDAEDHVLLLTLHHIVSDGWSQGILSRELTTLYNAFRADQPSPLPELPIQYADYAAWQRAWLTGEELARQFAYWKENLAGAPTLLELPTDRPRPPMQTFHGALKRRELSGELTQRLKALSQQEGATLFMTLLAAYQTLLFRYSGQDDIVVGTPIANRTRTEVEGLIGFFLNMLAMRGDLSGDPSFQVLLGRIREAA
ncbi:MAG TPA: amino acid adenylation domain-containing protein, partial [Chthonomonadaceae bacterium]|nr:amino acid adenylation domain-containing protein [Chthonomonadaceae bacterium]